MVNTPDIVLNRDSALENSAGQCCRGGVFRIRKARNRSESVDNGVPMPRMYRTRIVLPAHRIVVQCTLKY